MSASIDNREAILGRLVEIAQTVVEPGNVFRNQIEIPEKQRPAILIFDADETADEAAFGRGRPAFSQNIMIMSPEIFILAEGKHDVIGGVLNGLRATFIKAVTHDASLIALCKEGDIRYEGFATGFAAGRSMEGEAGISFSFRYVLRPNKL